MELATLIKEEMHANGRIRVAATYYDTVDRHIQEVEYHDFSGHLATSDTLHEWTDSIQNLERSQFDLMSTMSKIFLTIISRVQTIPSVK